MIVFENEQGDQRVQAEKRSNWERQSSFVSSLQGLRKKILVFRFRFCRSLVE